ncbi:unnamed protein product [Heligmosomoides polygyrus]|uniref:CCHC-type domain-containing protein n=1 Tax=Heligmosomoides polygyrus TaxID=6339 RepID=A0A3P7ZW75_HELPZ|nr:unnamed protein product [Heligmosomoides polygyrus]
MESDAQMADAELEQLLLEEPVASEQIASMKASIDRLVGTVQEMAQKTALQVRISQFTIRDKVSVLMELPTTVAELIRASAPSEDVSSDAPDKVRRTLAQECAVIEGELEKLDFVQKQLKEIASKLNTTLADALDEYSVQAEHDDRCMRELAELLAVSSTEVVGSVKQLLEVASRNGRENGERQDADPAKVLQERASSARAATEVVVEQLNRQEFENVEYHATFDPIAAAQGKLRSLPNELMLKNSFQQPKTSELQPKPKGGRLTNVVESQSRTSQRPMANETEEGDGSEKRKKKQPKCFNCNESGHFRRDCKAPRKVGESDKTTAQRRKAEGPKVFTASLDKWLCGAVESAWRKDGLVGERTVRNVNLLGLSKKALLDTGSQISIVPLEMLRAAREAGFDLNADVEEVPIRCQDAVYDASGNRMRFKGAVQLTLQLEGDAKQRVSLFVMAGGDDMIVLGTNALHLLGFGLTKVTESPYLQPHPNERGKCLTANSAGTSQREQRKFADTTTVVVSRRAYIRPGETKLVAIKCNQKSKEGIVWSDNDLIPDMVCTDLGNTVDVAVSNNSTDARILRAGQKVTKYMVDVDAYAHEVAESTRIAREYARETNDKMRTRMKAAYDEKHRVSESPLQPGDRVYMKIPSERQKLNPKLTNPWEGPYRVITVSENSALITLIGHNKEPIRVPFDGLRKLPKGISDAPLTTCRTRGKRGRPRKNKTPSCSRILCKSASASRILLGVDHPLHLRHRCQCALFNQMAHVALPSLTHPMARSKKVQDMFQLANVASISEQTCWGDERKEEELRKKNSSYITSYGLALAVDAHRRRCHPYAEAVERARGKRFDHSAVFETPVPFDLGEHLTTAIAMLDRVRIPGAVANDQDIFLAVPQPFSRVHPDVDYPDNVVPFVYQDWSALAHKLISMPITTSIIVVWPDTTPESREMRQVLIALERHLQCGGALAFFPSPYEDENIKEWTHMGRVCAEFVKYMTAPERSFDAVVRDHYSDVLEQAPFTHPACCLGTRPRSGKALFSGRQILLFLQKLRLTVNDLIRLDEFDFASPELKDHRRREKMLRNKRRRDEHRPNFWVIQDPERRRRELPLTFKEPGRQRHYQPARKDRERRPFEENGTKEAPP